MAKSKVMVSVIDLREACHSALSRTYRGVAMTMLCRSVSREKVRSSLVMVPNVFQH